MQTRLQKLELLRKALVTITKQLFPETPVFEVNIYFHNVYDEILDEARNDGFIDRDSNGTEWVENRDALGEIILFRMKRK